MKKENELIGQVSDEKIAEWKKKYNAVNGIVVGGHICYLRKLDRNTTSYALSQLSFSMKQQAAESDEKGEIDLNMGRLYKTGEVVLNNCWLGGSEAIKEDMSLWAGACVKAGELVEIKEAEIKKF